VAGEETPALSQEFGISGSGLRDLLRAEGVSLRGHAITSEDAERAVRLYESGLSITRVVAQVGYSHGTIRTALLKHGVAIRSVGHVTRVVSGE
jgi:AraC-like DNA-binding protein